MLWRFSSLTTHPTAYYKLLYTGDFFLSNSRLVEGLRLDELRGLNLDVLLIEGSYGTSRHPHRRNQENQLAERIHRAISSVEQMQLFSNFTNSSFRIRSRITHVVTLPSPLYR